MPAVAGDFLDLVSQLVQLLLAKRFEVASDTQVLLEYVHRVDAANEAGDVLAEGITAGFLGSTHFRGDETALVTVSAAKSLHADNADAEFIRLRHHEALKTAIVVVADVDGHLHGVPLMALEHRQMNVWVFVAGEADEANLAGLLSLEHLGQAAALNDPIGIVIVVYFVKLHEIDVIGAQPAQAVVDVLFDGLGVAAAVLGHEKALFAFVVQSQRLAHDLFAAAVVIIPGIVEKGQPLIESAVHDLDSFLLVLDGANVPTAQGDDRHAHAGLTQRPGRQSLGSGIVRALGAGGESQRRSGGERGLQEFTTIVGCVTHDMSPSQSGIVQVREQPTKRLLSSYKERMATDSRGKSVL